ncbi:MAG: enoyl-CoA hydratase/isomerase family protein [Thermoanaerobaculia bacterium]
MKKVTSTQILGGKVACITLSAPPGNIVDREMLAALRAINDEVKNRQDLVAIVLTAEGDDFSFGASIQEHLPDQIGSALESLHRVIRQLTDLPAPTIAAVRGRCLGGGLELVLGCDLILAETNAVFACPEIKLGVFPPAASALLPGRIGAGPAAELLLTGTEWTGEEAAHKGLVTRSAAPGSLDASLKDWLEADFLPRSATGLRFGVQAARRTRIRALEEDLPALEQLYLRDFMKQPDATKGIHAFLEKRRAGN